MVKRKTEPGGCPLTIAADVFGGEEALRKAAGHRATWSMWKTRNAVPWRVVGPELLKRWHEATQARGVMPESTFNAEVQRVRDEASDEYRNATRNVQAALRLVQKSNRLMRLRTHLTKSKK
jgi:hypothetical protein